MVFAMPFAVSSCEMGLTSRLSRAKSQKTRSKEDVDVHGDNLNRRGVC
jgi:hypothetical protein